MSDDFSPEYRAELLDDFYAECDELLTSVRTALVQLEQVEPGESSDAALLEALFRHVHSLKGISAIVGLRPAEQLAHAIEDVLRALTKRTLVLTRSHVDLLLDAARRFEALIIGHREGITLPDNSDILAQLRETVGAAHAMSAQPVAAPTSVPTAEVDPVKAARDLGLMPYRATFLPTPELNRRGITITTVRERFQSIGKILSATPFVRAPGSIAFEFVVGVEKIPQDLSAWTDDGIALAPVTEAAAPRPSDTAVETASLTPSHIVRVDLARLDDLMRLTGEMVINRLRLEDRINQDPNSSSALKEINQALARSLREMRETISRARLVPIAEIFARVPFVVRDLSRESEKRARAMLEGQQTEIDKFLVERLKEPLLHLVRNAFAHGVETPRERTAAGKPAEATILLRARSEGNFVIIQIRDDGRGVDAAAVASRAKRLGVPVPERLSAEAVLKILCSAGFSTRDEADMAAGRGVGMSVVANVVRELGGVVTLETELGSWTQFTLKLPLTLSIADAIIVKVGAQLCAVLQTAVDEIIQVSAAELRTINQTAVIPYRGALLPLVFLRQVFQQPAQPAENLTVLVLGSERGAAGLVVDGVRGQREIVVRPLSDPLLRVPGFSGTTELGDGRPLLILDSLVITQGVVRPPENLNSDASLADIARAS